MVFSFSLPTPSFESTNPRDFMNAFNQDLLAKAIANQMNAVKARYEEPKTLEDLTKSRLSNAHQELENKYYGPNIESEIGLRGASASHLGAETNKLNRMLPGEILAQALGNRQRQFNLDNPMTQNKAYGMNLRSLPADFKTQYLATLSALGYNPQESAQALFENQDLGDLAEAKGFNRDLSDIPNLNYAPTAATRTQTQRSNMATAGLDVADEAINKGIAHYAGQPTIKDVPLGFYKDALSGQNKDAQSDFIASSTLAQDQAFLRARQAGAPLSQGLLKHTLETSLTDKRANFTFVSPEVFKMAAEKIKKQFDEINRAENLAASGKYKSTTKKGPNNFEEYEKENPPTEYSDEDIKHTAKIHGLTEDQVREALRRKGTR